MSNTSRQGYTYPPEPNYTGSGYSYPPAAPYSAPERPRTVQTEPVQVNEKSGYSLLADVRLRFLLLGLVLATLVYFISFSAIVEQNGDTAAPAEQKNTEIETDRYYSRLFHVTVPENWHVIASRYDSLTDTYPEDFIYLTPDDRTRAQLEADPMALPESELIVGVSAGYEYFITPEAALRAFHMEIPGLALEAPLPDTPAPGMLRIPFRVPETAITGEVTAVKIDGVVLVVYALGENITVQQDALDHIVESLYPR